jgi:hypothetical protein
MTMTTPVKIATSVLVVLAAGAAVAAAQLSVTGNAKAIRFDRTAVAAENHAPGYTGTERGFLTMRSRLSGNKRSFELSWGTGVIKQGWAAVAERLTFAQQGGVTTWIADDLTPLCIKGSACKANLPAEVRAE